MKLFRLIIIPSLILLIGAGCNSDSQSLDLKLKCKELADKIYEYDSSNDVYNKTKHVLIDFGYSKKLNTCIYVGSVDKDGISTEYIVDSITNKVIDITKVEGSDYYTQFIKKVNELLDK